MKQEPTGHLPGIFDQTPVVTNNHLFYGDNLTIMKRMPSNCVDLIYLDPPFNSQRNYNLIYKQLTGQAVPEQEEAFCDAWEMDPEKEEMARNMPLVLQEYGADDGLVQFWKAWINALRNTQPRLLAYLIYMSYRLFEMRRILKPTGSLYLHCDPTASHYIKVILDGIFGHQNFRNEIVWKRTTTHSDAKRWAPVSDTILYYTKSEIFTWNPQYLEYEASYIADKYRYDDRDGRGLYQLDNITSPNPRPNLTYEWLGFPPPPNGWRYSRETMQKLHDEGRIWYPATRDKRPRLKRYLNESAGRIVDNIWLDIYPINSQATERLGYPTQKPRALLERIIQASSNPGDLVLDPFAGCGTAIYAAHLLGRQWIGCDIAILSVQLVRDVLLKRYGLAEGEHYLISGVPLSVEGAQDLFERDARQFQHWAVELAGGFSSARYSGDLGIDGRIYYQTDDGLKSMVLSVKGGKVSPAFMRELHGVLERESDSTMGGLICLQPPTKGMLAEAASAGIYHYLGADYHRLQIRTIEELLDGRAFDTPSKVQTLNWVKQLPLPL
jgi:DNA modification methylase